jgi:hypothetical protein
VSKIQLAPSRGNSQCPYLREHYFYVTVHACGREVDTKNNAMKDPIAQDGEASRRPTVAIHLGEMIVLSVSHHGTTLHFKRSRVLWLHDSKGVRRVQLSGEGRF